MGGHLNSSQNLRKFIVRTTFKWHKTIKRREICFPKLFETQHFYNQYPMCILKTFNLKPQVCVKLPQSCPTLCDPMDCSLSHSSVHGILKERILECVAIFLLQGIFPTQGSNLHLCNSCLISGFLAAESLGKPQLPFT